MNGTQIQKLLHQYGTQIELLKIRNIQKIIPHKITKSKIKRNKQKATNKKNPKQNKKSTKES